MTGRRADQRKRVLVVEGEPDVAALIKATLEHEGDLRVDVAVTREAALKDVAKRRSDLVVLDLSLPVIDVWRILKARPTSATVPIIMLTRPSESDRIRRSSIEVDDIVTTPFHPRDLAARVRAALDRRATAGVDERPLVYQGKHLIADFDAVLVTVDGEPVRLTRREFELLRFLVRNRNVVSSRDRLLEGVWGYEAITETRCLDVHIGRLRRKLGVAANQIETVLGLGYRFIDQP